MPLYVVGIVGATLQSGRMDVLMSVKKILNRDVYVGRRRDEEGGQKGHI